MALTAVIDLVIAGVGLAETGRFERGLLAMEYARGGESWNSAKAAQVGGYFYGGTFALTGVLECALAVTLFLTAGIGDDSADARHARLVPLANGVALVGKF